MWLFCAGFTRALVSCDRFRRGHNFLNGAPDCGIQRIIDGRAGHQSLGHCARTTSQRQGVLHRDNRNLTEQTVVEEKEEKLWKKRTKCGFIRLEEERLEVGASEAARAHWDQSAHALFNSATAAAAQFSCLPLLLRQTSHHLTSPMPNQSRPSRGSFY